MNDTTKNHARSNRQILIIVAAILAAGIGIWAAFRYTRVPGLSQVQLVEVGKGAIETDFSADVTLEPVANADLAFEKEGKIKNFFIAVGDSVKKGQLLAEQENSDYAVSLREAAAERDAAAAQLKQAREDVDIQKAKLRSLKNADAKKYDVKAQEETKDKSEAGVEAQTALLSAAESAVEAANLDLQKTRLTAPMDGVITGKTIEIGEVVAGASSVMTMASGDNLEAAAFVSEIDVKKLTVGNEAEIGFSSAGGGIIASGARIKTVYPAETSRNGVSSYKVVLELAEQNPELKSGMTGTAKVKISERSGAIHIPQSSLFSDAGKKYVMMMNNNLPERKEVQTGTYGSDGLVEITSGLSAGDKIIRF